MPLDLEALRVIEAIERRGSFAAAALELDRVPSAVTYTVRKLEDELDVLLFDRRGRRAELTPAGRELVAQGRRLLVEAASITARVQRIASGWESELTVAVDVIVPLTLVWPLVAAFQAHCAREAAAHTRLRLTQEVLGGTWDALAEGRALLVIGAPGEAPPGGGYRTRMLAEVPSTFVVAPHHPLAQEAEPLTEAVIARHRAVVAADSSRRLPPRSLNLLEGQMTLTVPDLAAKRDAQLAGLGCGFLPYWLAAGDVAAGRLVIKAVESPRPPLRTVAAWREARPGQALAWWIGGVERADWSAMALGPIGATTRRTGRARNYRR